MVKRGATLELVGETDGVRFVSEGSVGNSLDSISDAFLAFDSAADLNADSIAESDAKIRAENEKREKLIGARREARKEAERDISSGAESLKAILQDPESAIHPVLRAVLLAPGAGSGSLENPKTFHGLRKLGSELTALNGYLEEQNISQPIVLVSDMFNHKNQQPQMQLNFGQTIPNTGLTPRMGESLVSWHSSGTTEYGPQPLLTLPVEEDTINAVSPSAYNSHYVYADGQVVGVDHLGRGRAKQLSTEDFVPVINDLEIPIPVGNLDAQSTARPFVYYDRPGGDIEVIASPRVIGVSTKVTCAIGEAAILQLFTDLNNDGVPMGSEQKRVLRNMTLSVAHRGLSLAIKRGDFLKRNSL